jgi:hypothetical protein
MNAGPGRFKSGSIIRGTGGSCLSKLGLAVICCAALDVADEYDDKLDSTGAGGAKGKEGDMPKLEPFFLVSSVGCILNGN